MGALREIVLDTETTGFSPARGDRIVDIACVEIVDLMPTGREFQVFLDPERDVPAEAVKVHGLTREFLRGKPKFSQVADDFLEFIGDSPLVIHNANFDMGFLNAELARIRRPALSNPYVDTVVIAKRKYPGASATLDDLCKRFGVDLSSRQKHGALVDTKLLARVYLELSGGRERRLDLAVAAGAGAGSAQRPWRAPRQIGLPSDAEAARHAAFVEKALKKPLWPVPAPAEPAPAAEPAAPGLRR